MRKKVGWIMAAFFIMGIAAAAFAQPMEGCGMMPPGVGQDGGKGWTDITPPLTPEQTEKIGPMRTEHQKKVIDLRADLQKKQLDFRTLMMAAKPNIKEIHAVIDQMGALKIQLRKQQVSHRLAVRELLTPEQRASMKDREPGWGGRHGKHLQGKKPCQTPCEDMGSPRK
ncbi:MAG: Spy/CpxP family protein refolding chaperone [Candidatus Latescibacterota bacterium]